MAALVETESSLFACLQAPGSLFASAFLLSYANKKNRQSGTACGLLLSLLRIM